MTKTYRTLMLAAGIALVTTGSLAGAAQRTPLDANGDGSIDFTELQARRSDLTPEQFNAIDKDGNGLLSREELRAVAIERRQARAEERFKQLDTNGDGALSQEELNARWQRAADERFKKLDTDGDGKLSQAELNAAQEQARAFREQRRQHKGPGRHHRPGRGQGENRS